MIDPQVDDDEVGRSSILNARMRWVVIIVAVLSVGGTFASLLFGQKLTRPRSRLQDSFSSSAIGHRAFYDTLRSLGFHVVRHRDGPFGSATAPLLLIEPELGEFLVAGEKRHLGQALLQRKDQGLVTVIVLPKWVPEAAPERQGRRVEPIERRDMRDLLQVVWADERPRNDAYEYEDYEAPLDVTLPVVVRHRLPVDEPRRATFTGRLGTYRVEAPWLQSFHLRDGSIQVLLGTPEEALVIERYIPGRGRLILVSEPDLLHSYNIQRGDHAALWVALLRDELGTDTVVVDEVLHGFGQRLSLSAALGTFPLVLVPIHALLLILLCVLAGGTRFGPPRRVAPALGRGPREVIGVAASVFAAGRPAPQLAAAYALRVLGDVAQAVGLGSDHQGRSANTSGSAPMSEEERNQHLDDLAERKGQPRQAHLLWRQAGEYQTVAGRHEKEALRLAQRAFHFRVSLLAQQQRENRR